ncbi:voltage-dependent calcium channel beta subunit-associated regulatory protein isoform X1 [Carassius gibelio]|uniref:voltage-dependent calcium channel beta subunit-associated regulatory protein isoform X1 n=2 Tax=Carassius gibelio TaxID=101364 RepID=UPI002278EFD2|nr:voltage-dependent calcium channel beta subunit-associated regulatory protein isoform X1 [Carassius gibelio]XP_052405242.1 voltage-dependent calcium channel beta subunit-associated regulatory protein isoform X1 [Carassius gibelio]
MSDESPLQTRLTTDVPLASGSQENYVLLLVLLCVFAGGTLVLLSVLLIFCHRCCRGERRFSRASDDLEKTNTTYIEESQPTQDASIRPESGESLSSSGHGDTDAHHFLSAALTGRRVSFNEAAIYEQNANDQETGRRYTLTEGDFHHLKKARLTHLHMKILTILECDSPLLQHTSLSIFQPVEGPVLDAAGSWSALSPSCALPGNTHSSSIKPSRSHTIEVMNRSLLMDRDSTSCPAQGTMFHFLSKLRRHASLEGAGPFFSVKKWRRDTIQRAASLDTRGSPRRRGFQRQRAASETLDHVEETLQGGVSDFLLQKPTTQPQKEQPRRLSAGSLDTTSGAPPALSRLEVEAVMELRVNSDAVKDMTPTFPSTHGPPEVEDGEEDGQEMMAEASGGGAEEFGPVRHQERLEQHSLYRDIWSLRASLEQYASSDLSSNDRDSTRSDADSACSAGASRAGVPGYQSQDIDDDIDGDGELPYDDVVREAEQRRIGHDSVDSERGSDGEANNRKLLQMDSGYASIEAPCKAPEEFRLFGSSSGKTATERRRFFTNFGRKGTVCESFEAQVFKEELEDEVSESSLSLETETPVTGEPQPATKHRPCFRRRDYSIDEKTEALFNEFLRHDPQFDQQGSPSLRHRHRSRIHLRKQWQRSKQYSDPGATRLSPSLERQRCYPLRRGDSANFPLDTRYHSTLPRIASAADEEVSEGAASMESPEPEKSNPELEDADPLSETRSSGPDREENANNSSNNTSPHLFSLQTQDTSARDCGIPEDLGTNADPADSHKHSQMDRGGPVATFSSHLHLHTNTLSSNPTDPDQDSDYIHYIHTEISPSDKLASTLDDRLYSDLRTQRGSQECVVTVNRTSPDLEE